MNEEKGLIFNIQKFSVHDGPGIRTTVFMKGCPLQCLWCSNPESQSFLPELLVRDINCKGCGACVGVCPHGAITITKKTGRIINRQKCAQCLLCVQSCLYGSLNQCGQYNDVKNNILLENLQMAAARNSIWLRVPLIAGFNDSADHIKKIAALGRDVGVQKISLLPYHEGGKSKCQQLGTPYGFPDRMAPDDDQINRLKRIIEQAGLAVSVGN